MLFPYVADIENDQSGGIFKKNKTDFFSDLLSKSCGQSQKSSDLTIKEKEICRSNYFSNLFNKFCDQNRLPIDFGTEYEKIFGSLPKFNQNKASFHERGVEYISTKCNNIESAFPETQQSYNMFNYLKNTSEGKIMSPDEFLKIDEEMNEVLAQSFSQHSFPVSASSSCLSITLPSSSPFCSTPSCSSPNCCLSIFSITSCSSPTCSSLSCPSPICSSASFAPSTPTFAPAFKPNTSTTAGESINYKSERKRSTPFTSLTSEKSVIPQNFSGEVGLKSLIPIFNEIVEEYLRDTNLEKTVILSYPKVVQKSYTNDCKAERRFISPPPLCIVTKPQRNNRKRDQIGNKIEVIIQTSPIKVVHDNLETEPIFKSSETFENLQKKRKLTEKKETATETDFKSQNEFSSKKNNMLEAWYVGEMDHLYKRMDGLSNTSSVNDQVSYAVNGVSRFPRPVAQSVFKTLHTTEINSFSLHIKLFQDEIQFFKLLTDPIKVLSKPPADLRAVKHEIAIFSGKTVCLSNRSQSLKTKYLSTTNDGRNLSMTDADWEHFRIFKYNKRILPDINIPFKFNQSDIPLSIASLASRSHLDGLRSWGINELNTLKLDTLKESEINSDVIFQQPSILSDARVEGDFKNISLSNYMDICGVGPAKPSQSDDTTILQSTSPEDSKSSIFKVPDEDLSVHLSTDVEEQDPIFFGDVVYLQSVSSGLRSKPFILRKIVKSEKKKFALVEPLENRLVPGLQRPLCQLQKLAFESLQKPGFYLTNVLNNIMLFQTERSIHKLNKKDIDRHTKKRPKTSDSIKEAYFKDGINEFGIWTIVETEKAEVTFFNSQDLKEEFEWAGGKTVLHKKSKTQLKNAENAILLQKSNESEEKNLNLLKNFPILKKIIKKGLNEIYLVGNFFENVDADLKFWIYIGNYPCENLVFLNKNVIICELPIFQLRNGRNFTNCQHNNENVLNMPILFLREDGILFRTGHYHSLL
ncbi:hypothetical protein HDU92_006402 [Lobulomyces angularis]|nr:hypothetical protein HDU92_006402 [Lobulomyces angularis]